MTYSDIVNVFKNFKNHRVMTITAVVVYSLVLYHKDIIMYIDDVINKKIDKEHTSNYIVYSVWWHSDLKASGLRSFLYEFYPYNNLTDDQIKIYVKNIIETHTSSYVKEFNTAPFYKEDLGTWYIENYRYDSFLDDILDVMLVQEEFETEVDRTLIIESKIKIILELMKSYDLEMVDKINNYLGK